MTVDQPKRVQLPGESYSENKQCELVFGLGSKICPYMVSDGESCILLFIIYLGQPFANLSKIPCRQNVYDK